MSKRNVATFTHRVREATTAAHADAESQQFIQLLMSGALNIRALVSLMESLLPAYEALENQMRQHRDDSTVGLFDHRALDRCGRLRADLTHFGQRGVPYETPAVAKYVHAINTSVASPQRLLAHHYTRYLGDLAGGQAISRLFAELAVRCGLSPGDQSSPRSLAAAETHHAMVLNASDGGTRRGRQGRGGDRGTRTPA